MFPTKDMYFTEGGPLRPSPTEEPAHRADNPTYETDWARWSSAFTDMLRNWARCICVWNLVLDENGKPDITIPPRPSRPGGLVCVNSKTRQLTRSGAYFAFPHYSKTIRRGARIFASSGNLPGINHVAAENADGSRVLVMTSSPSALDQRVQCTLGSHALNLVLPPDSITSLVWS